MIKNLCRLSKVRLNISYNRGEEEIEFMDAFDINDFLKKAVANRASDEHLIVGQPPFIRKNGFMKRVAMPAIKPDDLNKALSQIAPQNIFQFLNTEKDMDFIYEIPACSRFRINYSRRLGNPAIVVRNIPYDIPTVKDLCLPSVVSSFSQFQSGLIIITGPTGSGKSTTLASIINMINAEEYKNIITIEDPIEYIFDCKRSMVSQRQLGPDVTSFANGVKYALRQDPDVILIGEIRDLETMDAALKAAETGHLVLATLHTNGAIQTVNRIVNLFDESNRNLARKRVAETLRAVVSQKLVYSKEKNKRYPACEIMIVTPTIRDYILKSENEEIYRLISQNASEGMSSLNQSLANLVKEGSISNDEAMASSTDKNEMSKILRGVYM